MTSSKDRLKDERGKRKERKEHFEKIRMMNEKKPLLS
jgi:hypothetical protein